MKIINFEPEVQLSSCRRNIFAFMALLILIIGIYSNSFDCSWHFDDLGTIHHKRMIQIKSLDWESIKATFFTSRLYPEGLYRPVSCLSLALNYYFGELNVFGYHLVNVGIHVLAAVFLYLFIYHTLHLPLLRPKYGSQAYLIALLSTVFWAVNPLQVQAVTYIVQRMASMAALFYIMAMFFYLKGRTASGGWPRIRYYAAFGISCLFAFGSKENTAMLPFSILLYDLFLIQGLKRENIKRNIYICLGLMIIPIALVLILRGYDAITPEGIQYLYENKRTFGALERILTQPRVIFFYISLLFYPIPQRLSISHDVILSKNLIDPVSTIIAIIAILAVVGVCLLKARKWPFICYCILFFFMNHAIEASFIGLELVFEHRNYLPSMLFFAPIAVLLARALARYSGKWMMQGMLLIFIVLMVVGFGNMTYLRNFD